MGMMLNWLRIEICLTFSIGQCGLQVPLVSVFLIFHLIIYFDWTVSMYSFPWRVCQLSWNFFSNGNVEEERAFYIHLITSQSLSGSVPRRCCPHKCFFPSSKITAFFNPCVLLLVLAHSFLIISFKVFSQNIVNWK